MLLLSTVVDLKISRSILVSLHVISFNYTPVVSSKKRAENRLMIPPLDDANHWDFTSSAREAGVKSVKCGGRNKEISARLKYQRGGIAGTYAAV